MDGALAFSFLFPIFIFYFFVFLFLSRGQGGGRAKGHDRGCREGDGGGLLRCPASSFYLLYWYKSTTTDAEAGLLRCPASSFCCFTGTKVQILTQKLEKQSNSSPRTPMASSLTKASRYSDFSVFLFLFQDPNADITLESVGVFFFIFLSFLGRNRMASLQGILPRGLKTMCYEVSRHTTTRP